ncbi:MAG: glycosyltransferase family 2 protein [Flavobacteriales bacterium]
MIYILIPVFNEEQNIENLFNELNALKLDEEVFFVFADDGSSDKSVELLGLYFAGKNHIVLKNGENKGPGYTFNHGFTWILENAKSDSDRVVTMEADTTSDLGILPHMLTISGMGYDLVLASVYAQGGGFDQTSFIRKFLSSLSNAAIRFLLGIQVNTYTSFYRVYHIGLLRRIKNKYPQLITENGFICKLEILMKAVKTGVKIVEVPMLLQSTKRKGKSKMKILKTSIEYLRFAFFKRL